MYAPNLPQPPKVSKIVLKIISRSKLDLFQDLTSPARLDPNKPQLTKADVVQAGSKTLMGRVFCEPLKRSSHFISSESYLAFTRHFLSLPPATTVNNFSNQPTFDYPVQRCLASHVIHVCPIDASGNHASSGCPSCNLPRMQKHNRIVRVLANAAQEAGLAARCEPDTHSVLLGEFSKTDCRRVFPKVASKAYKQHFKDLVQTIDFVSSTTCPLSSDEKQIHLQTKLDLLPMLDPKDTTGLRVDILIEDPLTGETKMVDVSVVHTTSQSYIEKELKAVASKSLSSALSIGSKLPDVLMSDPSPTVVAKEIDKREKYSRLLLVTKRQHAEGKRSSAPTFSPFLMSDFGEFSPAATELIDWLVDRFKAKCIRDGPRTDGLSTQEMIRAFRHKIKIGALLGIAAGFGSMLQAAGLPWGNLGPA